MGIYATPAMKLGLALAAFGFGLVRSDVPTNCVVSNLWGEWKFSLGLRGNVEEVTAGIKDPESGLYNNLGDITGEYNFKFSLYNQVVDLATGVEGTVTSIYNQGFQFEIYSQQWFVYWNFSGWDWASYDCSSTSVGFAKMGKGEHGEYVRIQGVRTSSAAELTETKPQRPTSTFNNSYTPEPSFIQKVNQKANGLWSAEHNQADEKYDLLEHQSRGGRPLAAEKVSTTQRNLTEVLERAIARNEQIHREFRQEKRSIPANLDWRNVAGVNYVSPVDDQASCGSCYSFASAGLMESRVRIASGNTMQPSFSEQEQITCGQERTYNQGCDGGWDILMAGMYGQDYGFVEENCNEETKYNTQTYDKNACPDTTGCQRWYTNDFSYLGGYFGATEDDGGKAMMLALQDGPLGVGFEVYDDFRPYKTGVYVHTGVSSEWNPIVPTNHAVLCVGYGTCQGKGDELCGDDTPAGTPYFIGKNSWGTGFGQQGFFLILRGTNEAGWESMPFQATPIIPI